MEAEPEFADAAAELPARIEETRIERAT